MSSAGHADRDDLPRDPASDRRGSPRALTVFKVVKIDRDGTEGLARCRNISAKGMKLEVAMPLGLNDDLTIELSPGHTLGARVVWTKGGECGVAFERSVDVAELFGQVAAQQSQQKRSRSPRLNSRIPARIEADGEVVETTIRNISQRGMLVSHDGSFRPGLQVKVLLNNGSARDAIVQWSDDNIAGLFLAEPYSVLELGDLSAIGQNRGPA